MRRPGAVVCGDTWMGAEVAPKGAGCVLAVFLPPPQPATRTVAAAAARRRVAARVKGGEPTNVPLVKPKALAWLATAAIVLACGAAAPTASAATRFSWMQGFAAQGTPKRLDKVGLLKVGPPKAKNVLIINPGTSASAAYFAPLARDIVKRTTGWQVWAIERRENLLEDHSMLNRVKLGTATPRQLFDYYLGFLSDSSVKTHFQFIQDSQVSFARRWGMRVTVEDLRQVVEAARKNGHRVVMAGHSLCGSNTTAYATWNFHGKPGASDLDGLVFIDGGSNPVPTTPQQASTSLNALNSGS